MDARSYFLIVWRKRCLVLAAFLSTLLATIVFTFFQTPVYEAKSTFVVSPTGTYPDAQSLAGVLDTMSRRVELANTYAEVAASRSIKQEVADDLGLSEAQRKDLVVESALLPSTNVLEIKVQGSDANLVALFADEVGAYTANYTRAMYEAYALQSLDVAASPTSPVKPNKLLNLSLGVFLGLVLGVGLAFLAYYVEAPLKEAASQGLPGTVPGSTQGGAVASTRTSRLGLVGWIVVAALILAVIGMGSALFLSQPKTSAAVLPVSSRTVPTFVPAAVWTPTPTATTEDITLLSLSPTPPCSYPSGWVPYEVQTADTLSSLGVRWNMTVAEIADANCMTRRVISAGQILYFPPPPETPTPETPTPETPTPGTPTPGTPTPGTPTLATPRPVPSMTPTSSAGLTAGSATALSATATSTAVPLERTSPTPVPTRSGGLSATTPSPAAKDGTSLPAPVLLAPANGAEFQVNDKIVLTWQPVQGLPHDAYYVITVAYSHLGQTWYDDVPWTREPKWTLSEHSYLLDLSDDGLFTWSVQVVRQVAIDSGGTPEGVTLSAPSETRRLSWKLPSGGGGRGGTPTVPAP